MKLLGISGRKGSGKTSLATRITLEPGYGRVVRVAMAEPIKHIAVDILGLPPALVYGDDDAKQQLTQYYAHDMPGFPRDDYSQLSVRRVLQILGTEIFRHMDSDIWIKTLFRRIATYDVDLVIVDDVRFANEADAIKRAEGKLVRLLRHHANRSDNHVSENAVDDYEGWDLVVPDLPPNATFLRVANMLETYVHTNPLREGTT